MTNVGSRPTFNGTEQTVETYLLEPLEGRAPSRIEPAFLHRLRDEERFASAEDLREQILRDVESANVISVAFGLLKPAALLAR